MDKRGRAVEALPEQEEKQTNCREITNRQSDNGKLISETVDEICEGVKTPGDY